MNTKRDVIILFISVILIYCLNDFINIFVKDFTLWVIATYILTFLLPILGITYLIKKNEISLSDLGLTRINVFKFLIFTIIFSILGIIIDQIGWDFFKSILPDTKLGGFPNVDSNSFIYKFDLHFGLLMVAIVEEIVFRGLSYTILSDKLKSASLLFIISGIIFGLVHWSLGIHAIINTAILGSVFMLFMWKTGNILPLIAAHFVVNYVAFTGLINLNQFIK